MRGMIVLIGFALLARLATAGQPEEVGLVNWGRDYDTALQTAKATGKPVFLLFQEVPGCAGCKQFGNDVLSHPEVVDRIEKNFVPLLIHNNKGGEDARIRKRFNEPAWNYQVVRFLDAEGKDIIPRKDRVWTKEGILARIESTLARHPNPMPAKGEVAKSETARIALCQYCFWTGEMKIGAIDGVLQTEAGFIEGREVTLVTYDPSIVSIQQLVKDAQDQGVASSVYLDDPSLLPGSKKIVGYRRAPERDQKRQLQGTPFARLDLSAEQATKVNAYARTSPQTAIGYLTPEQKEKLVEIVSKN